MEMSTKESLQIPVGDFCGGAQEKSLKSCWWFPGELPFYSGANLFFYSFGWSFGRSSVGELRELWILASVASTTTTWSSHSWSTTTRSTPQGGGYFISLFIDISKYWKEKGKFFASEFPPSPSWASCPRHEIKCFLHRFVTPKDLLTCHLQMCTSQELLPGHLSILDLAVSLWQYLLHLSLINMLFAHASLKKAWQCFICRLLGAMLFYMDRDCHLFFSCFA